MSSDRTPLRTAAKRVYEALVDAEAEARDLIALCADDTERHFAARVEMDIGRLFHPLAHLMHEEDCQ